LKVRHIRIQNFRGIKSLSWRVKGDFSCIIGPGDTCKSTVLSAVDYALSPRVALAIDDADFYDQDVENPILIQVTLADWDESSPDIATFFQESKYAQFKCGLSDTGPLDEPTEGGIVAVSISLRIDKSLEPKWWVVKGPDSSDEQDRKAIFAPDRAILGLTRLDTYSDAHFAWGRNSVLTRLSEHSQNDLNALLSALAREMRQSDISLNASVIACQTVADAVKTESIKTGVKLASLSPKLDIQRQSTTGGAISLHEGNVPLRHKGSGSKKLIAAAMQMKLHDGKNISLIDEIESGLEPHRIRGLIFKLKNSPQQIFTTTHSPVVLRELIVGENDLYVCKRSADGVVTIESLATVPDVQGAVRSNAEALLGSKIVVCEGPTEIGLLRAYDKFRLDQSDPPVWTLATSYFNAGGGGKIKSAGPKLAALGYKTAVLCDNDAADQLSVTDIATLRVSGIHICQWETGNSTERQLLIEMPWNSVPALLSTIGESHDTLELSTIINLIQRNPGTASLALGADSNGWPESIALRQIIGDLANEHSWIKRIDYAAKVFRFALPLLAETSVIRSRLSDLWTWIQQNE
jgi:hypothetical protein